MEGDFSMVNLHQLVSKMQTDAKVLARITALHETAEQLGLLLLRYSYTGISHSDYQFSLLESEANHYPALHRRIFKGIGKQIKHHLVHLLLV